MIDQNYLFILILWIFINPLKAEVDTTKNKVKFEINSDFLIGQSVSITQKDVVNLNSNCGFGIQVGCELNQSHVIKLGVGFNKSLFDYRIVMRNVLIASGELIDFQKYKEVINITNASVGLIFSSKIEDKLILDFEILSFRLLDEQRKREKPSYMSEGLVDKGINLATGEYFFGVKTRFKFSLNSHIKLGANFLISNEKIKLPDILNDSKLNVFLGTSIAYEI